MRPAVLARERRSGGGGGAEGGGGAGGKNLLAAYHGLLHVSGRAGRPDVALRLAYAMGKEGLEPSESALNCYNAGKRIRETAAAGGRAGRGERDDVVRLRMEDQYESLLMIECTKYDQNDRRRSDERRVRIIF